MNQESRKKEGDLRSSEITRANYRRCDLCSSRSRAGFLESVYEEALAVEFAFSGIQFVRQKSIVLFYKDHQIGEHRLDFLVEETIVVELKAIVRWMISITQSVAAISRRPIWRTVCS